MDPRQYDLAQRVFTEVCDRPREEWTRCIEQACGDDAEVRAAVRDMLARDGQEIPFADGGSGRGRLMELLEKELGGSDGPSDERPIVERIGPYRLVRKVGQGGMGTVFEAEQEQPRRTVAIKMLRQGGNSPRMLRRFAQEIELLGRLQHPGIAQIYGAGTVNTPSGSAPYFAMEFVGGAPLTRFASDHALPVEQRLRLIAQACDAVHFAHQKGVLHRDLKPSNILVWKTLADDPAGGDLIPDSFVLKILDFGIARALDDTDHQQSIHTETGQIIGTVCYMSPEQLSGGPAGVDIRADVYALGVILYELLSGRLPHDVRSRSLAEAARMVAFDPPTRLATLRPELRGDLEAIVSKALEQDADRRYPSASELAADIRRYLAHEPVAARPLTTLYQISKFARRNRGLVWGLAAAACALVLGVAGTSIGLYRAIANERRAVAGEAMARQEAYVVSLAAADAISGSDPARALRLLDGTPSELRGWEWNHYRSRLDHTVATIDSEAGASVAVDPRCGPVAAVSREGRILILQMTTGKTLTTCTDRGALSRPALSRNGSRLAALRTEGSGETSVVVFDAASAAVVAEFRARSPEFSLSAEGRYLAVDGPERGLLVLDLSSGAPVLERPPAPTPHKRHFSLQPEGCITIVTRDGGEPAAEVVEFSTGNRSLRTGSDLAAADPLDRRGDLVVIDSRYNLDRRSVEIVSARNWERVSLLRGHSGLIQTAALSADGARVATTAGDHTVRVWDAVTGETQLVIPVESEINSLAWAADGGAIASVDARGRAVLLSLEDPAVRVLRGHASFVYHAAFSTDSTLVASASWNDAVRVWDAASGSPVAVLDRAYSQIYPPTLMGLTRDGLSLFVVEQGDTASVWDLRAVRGGVAARDTSSPLAKTVTTDPWSVAASSARRVRLQGGQSGAVSKLGHRVALDAGHGRVRITDAQGHELRTLTVGENELTAVAISPDERTLATCADESAVRVWRLDNGDEICSLSRHSGKIFSLDFSPDGRRLASAGSDNIIVIWDTESWQPVAELRGHEQYVNSVSFSPDGTQIVSASGDGTVRIWDSKTRPERLAISGSLVTPTEVRR